MSNRRLGKFTLPRQYVWDFLQENMNAEPLRILMDKIIVLGVDNDLIDDKIYYTAWCEEFAEIDRGSVCPEYECQILRFQDMESEGEPVSYQVGFLRKLITNERR